MELKLPLNVVSQIDIARMLREVKVLEDTFIQTKALQHDMSVQIPVPTKSLAQIAADNNYDLRNQPDLQKLAVQLDQVIGRAPLLHISFASEPSPVTLEKILFWLRSNIHPLTLLQVGLQPTIAAGCVLRTPNKVFDMSMRNYLKTEEPFLAQLINVAAKREVA